MEVKAGYKLTDVGVIPEDWDLVPLGRLFAFTNGVNADRSAYGRGIPFINVLEPITHSHIYGPEISGRVQVSREVASSYAVRRGDVVFNRTSETDSELGLAAVYMGAEPVVFGGFVIRGRAKDESLDLRYAGDALRSPHVRSQIIPMGQGAVRSNIGQQNLGRVLVPIPPKSEQLAVAEALADLRLQISSMDRLIAKKRGLRQAAIQQLLTGQTRLPGFRGEWEVKQLGEALTIRHGKSQRGVETTDGQFPILATGGQIGRTSTPIHEKASVLIGRKGTINRPQYMDTPFWTVDTLFYSEMLGENDARFFYYLFTSIDWMQYNEGSGVPSLNARTIESIEKRLPSTLEQKAIASALAEFDAELSALEARRDKTRALKDAMMQELLTGRTRLV